MSKDQVDQFISLIKESIMMKNLEKIFYNELILYTSINLDNEPYIEFQLTS